MSRGWLCLLPLDLQPDLSLPGIGVVFKGGLVIDVAVESRAVIELVGSANPELTPVLAKVGGERDEAVGRGELRRRVAEELVPEIGSAPHGQLPATDGAVHS